MLQVFKNMRIGSKIGYGFAVVLILASVASVVGWNGMRGIVDRVDKTDDVNQLITDILQARQQEKNFIIRQDPSYVDKVEKELAQLSQHANETRKRFKQKINKAQMDQVAAEAGEYAKAFDHYVTLENKKNEIMAEMRQKARTALERTEAIRSDQKRQLQEIRKAGGAFVSEKLLKADDASRLLQFTLEAKAMRMSLMHQYDENLLAEWEMTNQKILDLTKNMKSRFKLGKNVGQAERILEQYQEYMKTFLSYLETGTNKDLKTLVRAATASMKEMENIRADQKEQLRKRQIETDARIDDKLTKADDANRMIKWLLDARKNEKEFIISGDHEHFQLVQNRMEDALNVAANLASRFKLEENARQAKAAIRAIQAYREAFMTFTTLMKQQTAAGEQMVQAAREVQKVCHEAVADQKHKMKEQISAANSVIITAASAAVILGMLIAAFISRTITHPISKVVCFIKKFGEGDLSDELHIDTKDEIGEMVRDMNHAIVSLRGIMKELTQTTNCLSGSSHALSSVSEQMASSAEEMNSQANTIVSASEQVNTNVGRVASSVAESSASLSDIAQMTEEMSSVINDVAKFGKKTADNVAEMALSAQDMSQQVSSVASASEEMTSSLNEVAKNTAQANQISQNASQRTHEVNARLSALVASSVRIGKIVGVIKDIADQTNMLALNAAIEAAGAGEAGKGFAVVAGEVKTLAKQSADSTDEIAGQIEEIQTSTHDVVQAMEEIGNIINEIADINEMIAASSEEQTATASEISKSIAGTASAVEKVAKNANASAGLVREIAKSTGETSKTVAQVGRNIDELLNAAQKSAQASDESAGRVKDISESIRTISATSQQTAAIAAQTRASSRELARAASMISHIVTRFKV